MEINSRRTNLICQLKHPDPWRRRRAIRVLKSSGRIQLRPLLQELDALPADVLPEVLDWLGHWQWPNWIAPTSGELKQCVKLLEHSNPAIARTAVKLLQGLSEEDKIPVRQAATSLPNSREAGAYLPLLTIDMAGSRVCLGDKPCDLTQHQKRILHRLAESRGHYVSAGELYFAAQGEYYVYDRAGDVKSNIRNLRGRLGDDGKRQYYIQSKKHVGYRLNLQNVKVI